jgi:hypothetical protein
VADPLGPRWVTVRVGAGDSVPERAARAAAALVPLQATSNRSTAWEPLPSDAGEAPAGGPAAALVAQRRRMLVGELLVGAVLEVPPAEARTRPPVGAPAPKAARTDAGDGESGSDAVRDAVWVVGPRSVDVAGVVLHVTAPRRVTTRAGRDAEVADVFLLDESCVVVVITRWSRAAGVWEPAWAATVRPGAVVTLADVAYSGTDARLGLVTAKWTDDTHVWTRPPRADFEHLAGAYDVVRAWMGTEWGAAAAAGARAALHAQLLGV